VGCVLLPALPVTSEEPTPPEASSRGARWGATAAWTALYALAVVAFTWPLGAHLVDHLPKGNVPTSVPASAGAWALWWVSDRLAHGFVGLWEGPIFYPAAGTFGYSETTLPLGIAAAPLLWMGAELPLVYNLVVLGSLVLNGLAARSLAHTLHTHPLTAGLVGLMMAVTPLGLIWISVLPLVPLFGITWFFRAMIRFGRDPGPRTGAEVGGTLALSWLLCLQYGLFLTLVAPLMAGVVKWRERGTWRGIGVGAVVLVAILAPVLLPQRAILEEHGFERTEERAEKGAFAIQRSWWDAPVEPRLHIPGPGHRPGSPIYPGTLPLLLVAVALARRGRDREVVSLSVVAGTAMVLSVLPTLPDVGPAAWDWLRDHVPGLALIREGKRAGASTVALLPALVALGLDPIVRHRKAWPAAIALVAATLVNEFPEPAALQSAPTVAAHRALVDAIVEHVPEDGVLLMLPYTHDASKTPEADRMVLQAGHGRRLVNGYSSYYPPIYWKLRRAFKTGPDAHALQQLREVGVTHLVVPPDWLDRLPGTELVWRGEDEALVRLLPEAPEAPPG
ncbi:MAG: hypothetical protein KC621_35170, partial [Myxococcales bacterium]|nr:hypothetical protein [Myxococcales bacterium]